MFRALARVVVGGKWLVIAAWVALAAGMYLFAPSLSQVGMASDVAFLPKDAPSWQAQQVLVDNFPQLAGASDGLLVIHDATGLTDADRQYTRQLEAWLHSSGAPPQVGSITSPLDRPEMASLLVSKDGTTMLLRIDFTSENYSDATNHAIEQIRQHIAQTHPSNLSVEMTGQAAIGRDLLSSILDAVSQTTLVTILLVILVLLVIYRSPIAAAVPLVTIGIAFLITRGVLGLLVQGGMKVSSMVEAFIVVLIFGAGTDYALFLISRYREEVAARPTTEEAAIETVARIGPVITASGSTVIIGTLGLIIARFEMTRTQGPAMALGIAIALFASLTLTPALLSVFGRYLFWPFHKRHVVEAAGASTGGASRARGHFWPWVAEKITTRPWVTIAVVSALLLLPYIALAQFTRSFNVLNELPAKIESRHAFDVLKEHFDQGEMLPITVALTSTTSLASPGGLAHIAQAQADLASVEGVDRVRSIVDPTAGQDPAGAKALLASEQVLGISRQIEQSFGGQAITGTATLTTSAGAMVQLDFIGTYLDELGAAFPQARSSAAFNSAKSALGDVRARLGDSLQALQVSNQLSGIVVQVEKLANSLGAAPTPTPAAQQGTGTTSTEEQLRSIYAYLTELAQAYPEVKSDPGYSRALQALALMTQLKTPEQRAALRQAVSSLASALRTLNTRFQSRDALFTPKSIQLQSGSDQGQKAALSQAATELSGALQQVAAALPPGAYFLPDSLVKQQPALGKLLDTFLSPDRTVAQVYVLLASNPYSEAAIKTVDGVDETANRDAEGWGMEAYAAGPTVQVRDIHQMVSDDLPRVMALVVSGVFLVFVLLLGSLVAPIYLVGTVLLSYGTTMGLSTIFFQGIMGQEGINYVIPTIIFVLLVALGADYNIFLISRVWEESSKGGSVREGVRRASSFTGGVITSAGIILAGTFASLIIAPIQTLLQVGAAVAVGVLVDTFIVRALLVPAIAAVVGRWNWWPARRPAGSGGALRAFVDYLRRPHTHPPQSKPGSPRTHP